MKIVILEKETLNVCTIFTENEDIKACLKQDFPEDRHLFINVSDNVTIKNIKVNPDGTITTDNNYLYDEIRTKRNQLLMSSDWTHMTDSPLPLNKKTEWALYRQQLRDLPSVTQDPDNPSWPIPPQ